MSMENDLTAKIFGKILAEGMSLADCDMENKIDSEAVGMLKEIKEIISSGSTDRKKVEEVEEILTKLE